MGLFGGFVIPTPSSVVVKLLSNDGLSAVTHMDMPHSLLSRLVKLGEGFHGRPAVGLGLQGKPGVSVGGLGVVVQVQGRAPA